MAATTTRRTRGTGTGAGTRKTSRSQVIEVDFDDYEEPEFGEYMGEDPRPGVYAFKLVGVQEHVAQSSGNKGIKWMFVCGEEPYDGWLTSMYSDLNPDGSKWKTQQIVKAVMGGKTENVKLDLKNPDKFLASCVPVLGRVVSDSWEDEESGEVRTSSKLKRVVADLGDNPRKGKAGKAKDEDDDEYDSDGFEDAEDDEDLDDEEDFDDEEADEDTEEDGEDEDEDADDEDDAEDDEQEEDPPPARRAARKRVPAKKAASKAAPAKKAAPARRARR